MNDLMINKIDEEKQQLQLFKEMANVALKSGKYSKDYDEATILNVFLTARDMGISPMKALNGGFYIVNGKISMSTALMADRIRKAGHSVKIIEWNKEKCVIIGKRRDNDDSAKVEYTLEDAQLAGLLASPTWKKFPKSMIYNRAMSMLARVLFPDVVGNCYDEDEKNDIQNIPPADRAKMNPEHDIIVDVLTGEVLPNRLSEEQCAQLDILLEGKENKAEKIKERFSLKDVYDLPEDEFDRVCSWLRKEEVVNG